MNIFFLGGGEDPYLNVNLCPNYVKLTKFDTGKFFCNIIHFPPVADSIFDSILISWAPITGHGSPGGRKITT